MYEEEGDKIQRMIREEAKLKEDEWEEEEKEENKKEKWWRGSRGFERETELKKK